MKYLGPIPINVLILLALFVAFFYILEHTSFGRHLYAIGSNKEAARLSGINTKKVGAVLGVVIIGVLNNGLVLLGIDVYWTQVVKGAIILIAVSADAISAKRN